MKNYSIMIRCFLFVLIATTVLPALALAQTDIPPDNTREGASDEQLIPYLAPVVIDPNEDMLFNKQPETVPYYMANLYKLVVDAFERAGEWRGEMPREEGIITVKRFYAAPRALAGIPQEDGKEFPDLDGRRMLNWPSTTKGGLPNTPENAESLIQEENARKELLKEDPSGTSLIWTPPRYKSKQGHYEYRYFDEVNVPDDARLNHLWGNLPKSAEEDQKKVSVRVPNERCLGVKIQFMRRGYNEFTVVPPKPVYLEGVVKAVEIWACGRNKRHSLFAWIQDIDGADRYIELGSLNFLGWRKLVAPISPRIKQADWQYTQKRGITFRGFIVKCNPEDSYGSYYLYLDNFSALIDRYFEENRSVFDPSDLW